MSTLVEFLSPPQRRARIIADCVRRVEAHAATTRGIRGLALKAGLAALNAARPNALPRAAASVLPEFAAALDPYYQRFLASGQPDFAVFLEPHRAQACASLLEVTDARAARTSHRALRATYRKLRGTLASELERLLPDIVRGLSEQVRSGPGRGQPSET